MAEHGSLRQSPVRLTKGKGPGWLFLRWTLVFLACLLVIAAIVVIGISVKVGWELTHPDRMTIASSPAYYGLDYESFEVMVPTDQIKLQGWKVESPDDPKGVIVLAHGYRQNRVSPSVGLLGITKDLIENQYHVLLFDFRNSGESEGKLTSVGQFEQDDLIAVLDYAAQLYPDLPLGVMGFSMGAVTAILVAEKHHQLKAIIADSPFADFREYLEENLSFWSDLPDFPFTPTIINILPLFTGIDSDRIRPIEAVKSIQKPLLLIHGGADDAIPFNNSERILNSAPEGTAELWIVDDSDHVKAYIDQPEAYMTRVLTFFSTHLN